jgi:hypothetical protein
MSKQRKRNRFLSASPSQGSGYKHKPKDEWGVTPRTAGARRRWERTAIQPHVDFSSSILHKTEFALQCSPGNHFVIAGR